MSQPTVVLVFSKRANAAQAAKLHSSECSVVAAAERKPMAFSVVRENVADECADLRERIYPVRACKCTRGMVLP